jgi:hypothetical protein
VKYERESKKKPLFAEERMIAGSEVMEQRKTVRWGTQPHGRVGCCAVFPGSFLGRANQLQ